VRNDVDAYVQSIRQRLDRRIGHEDVIEQFHDLWVSDFLPATAELRRLRIGDLPEGDPQWEEVVKLLPEILHDIDVRVINGTAGDVLDYEDNKDRGLKVIAIGGDKLARGLTLEGLCTSYFLRASRMYDTLMQMGRWFGYRPGYLDLCRLYTSSDLVRWFKHVSDAASELREEFDLMANSGATPREYGLKVQSHPELMVTSQIKMRSAKTLQLSYSGQLMQTVSLPISKVVLDRNLAATKNFVAAMGRPTEGGSIERRFGSLDQQWHGHIWKGVSFASVVDFLLAYETNETAHKVNSKVLAEFVQKMAANGELTTWTVALLGLKSGDANDAEDLGSGVSVNRVKRGVADAEVKDRYAIGVLLDPKDESIDLTDTQWRAALSLTVQTWEKKKEKSGEPPSFPSGPAIRKIKGIGSDGIAPHPENGLLILYVLDPNKALPKDDNFPKGLPSVVAFGISFPGSKSDLKVEYKVNNVGWEQDYGASE
jgi:hypothetical protein